MKMFILFFTLILSYTSTQGKDAYRLKMKIKGAGNDTVYLSNYFGKQLYYADTAYADPSGNLVFSGEEPLKGGMYVVFLNANKYFEILIDEQEFSLETDTADFTKNMKFSKTKNNQVFYDYMHYLSKKRVESDRLKAKRGGVNDAEKKKLNEEISAIDQEVMNYQRKVVQDNQGELIAKIIKMSLAPEIAKTIPSTVKDSALYAYNYFKNHYWDNVDLQDDRLVRTTFIKDKLDYFIQQVVLKNPDSLIVESDRLISKLNEGTDMYKFVVHYLTYHTESSKIMGMDGAFVHLVNNYYKTGKAFWMNEEKLKKIIERAETLTPILIGKIGHNLTLLDTAETTWNSIHDTKADFTILVFWSPDCGHCKKEIPKLHKIYKEKLKHKDIEVYAVSTQLENHDWRAFIKKHKLEWINVSDTPETYANPQKYLGKYTDLASMNFRKTYDVYSTPKLFILNQEKRIIAKGFGTEQLEEIMEQLLKLGERNPK